MVRGPKPPRWKSTSWHSTQPPARVSSSEMTSRALRGRGEQAAGGVGCPRAQFHNTLKPQPQRQCLPLWATAAGPCACCGTPGNQGTAQQAATGALLLLPSPSLLWPSSLAAAHASGARALMQQTEAECWHTQSQTHSSARSSRPYSPSLRCSGASSSTSGSNCAMALSVMPCRQPTDGPGTHAV